MLMNDKLLVVYVVFNKLLGVSNSVIVDVVLLYILVTLIWGVS